MDKLTRFELKAGAALVNIQHLMYAKFDYSKKESLLMFSGGAIQEFSGDPKFIENILIKAANPVSQPKDPVWDELVETPKEAVLRIVRLNPDLIFSTRSIASHLNITIERAREAAQALATAGLIYATEVSGRRYYSGSDISEDAANE